MIAALNQRNGGASIDTCRGERTNLNAPATAPGALTAADFPTTRRYPRTASEAFKDADYATALDGFPAEQPDPFASFEDFLDWIDARWRTWFACGIAIAASLAVFTLYFAKGGTPQ